MPLAERVARWQGDIARVRAGHAAGWATGFLDALVSAVPMG